MPSVRELGVRRIGIASSHQKENGRCGGAMVEILESVLPAGILGDDRRLNQLFRRVTQGTHHRGYLLSIITLTDRLAATRMSWLGTNLFREEFGECL